MTIALIVALCAVVAPLGFAASAGFLYWLSERAGFFHSPFDATDKGEHLQELAWKCGKWAVITGSVWILLIALICAGGL